MHPRTVRRRIVGRSLTLLSVTIGCMTRSALLAALIGAVGAIPAAAAIRPAGDLGGQILQELSAIRSSIPPHMTNVNSRGYEPVITDSCSSTIPSVTEYTTFSSRQSVAQIESEVSARMHRSGWEHRSKSGGQWYANYEGKQVLADNDIVRWTRRLPQGLAAAQLAVAVPVSGWDQGDPLEWSLAASARGIHEPNQHCGAP